MATKERIEAIRVCLKTADSMGGVAPGASWRERTRLLLVALDDANKRIAKLEADLDRVAPRQKAIGTVYLTPGETIEKLEAKLAKVRFWADADSANGDSNVSTDTAYEQLLAILDGKDTP